MTRDKLHSQRKSAFDMADLLQIMRDLRNPDTGCPWDVEQTFNTIAPYTIEEAYEVADAIEAGDLDDLRDELGDLLLQVVFHARMAEEQGAFDFNDVVGAICAKMIRRHPHVFGDESRDKSAGQQTKDWEKIKAEERGGAERRALDGVTSALPAFTRAVKLQNRAARVGFDWPDTTGVINKIVEESQELVEARDSLPQDKIEEEFGDLAFVLANLGRHLGLDPEAALRKANSKFTRRFNAVEDEFRDRGLPMADQSLEELDRVWDMVKSRPNT